MRSSLRVLVVASSFLLSISLAACGPSGSTRGGHPGGDDGGGDPGVDDDGYAKCEDCDDTNPLVNPGAVEVQVKADGSPEGVDNNCNGIVDEPSPSCDSSLDPNDPMSYAKAMGLCDHVLMATFNGDS